MQHTIREIDGELVVQADNGSIQPISILDRFRITNDPAGNIGIRYWDETWNDYSFLITGVKEGTDVTLFINRVSNQ